MGKDFVILLTGMSASGTVVNTIVVKKYDRGHRRSNHGVYLRTCNYLLKKHLGSYVKNGAVQNRYAKDAKGKSNCRPLTD